MSDNENGLSVFEAGILVTVMVFLCSGCGKKDLESLGVPPDKLEFADAVNALRVGEPDADLPFGPGRLEFIKKNIGDEDVLKLTVLQEGQLTHLGLAFTKITNRSMETIAKIPGLQNLDIAGAPINNEGLTHFADHPTLKRIVLNETAITDAGLEIVATMPNLECLEVYQCSITDYGLRHVSKMKNLTLISLDCTKITDKGLPFLYPLTKLKRLQVGDTGVSEQGLKTLREKMPDVSVRF